MSTGTLVVIRGPAGAGKSTVARLVVDRLPGKVALVEPDRFFDIPQRRPTVLDPEKMYLVHTAVGRTARTFLDAGYFVVVEGVLVILELPVFLAAAQVSMEGAFIFTLLPSLEVTYDRNSGRGLKNRLPDGRVRRLHEWVEEEVGVPGMRIDSSDQSPEETATVILAALERGGSAVQWEA